jgi:SAM-dependent methyltransferase
MAEHQDDEWTRNKIKTIINHYGHRFFYQKRVLDLGCGTGDVGAAFARLGAEVFCVDARQSNLDIVQKKHPYLQVIKTDIDDYWPIDIHYSYDIIISLDLLCHLKNFDKHFDDICSRGEHIILETEVLDSNDPNSRIQIFEEKSISTLSFNGIGNILSSAHIEAKLANCGAEYKRISDPKLNSGPYKYDWMPNNSGKRQSENRKLWFIHKNKMRSQQMNAIKRIRDTEATIRQSQIFNSSPDKIKFSNLPLGQIRNTALCLFGEKPLDTNYNINFDICDIFIYANAICDDLKPVKSETGEILLSDTKNYFACINKIVAMKERYERECLNVYDRVVIANFSNTNLINNLPGIVENNVLLNQRGFVSNSIISDIYGDLHNYIDQYLNNGCQNNIMDLIVWHFKEFGTSIMFS